MPDSLKVISNAFVLSCNQAGTGGIGTVVVRNDRIQSVSYGVKRPVWSQGEAERIDGTGKIVLPGFIDLHFHGESYLLGILAGAAPDETRGTHRGLSSTKRRLKERTSRKDWEAIYRAAYFSALRSGVTFLCEYGTPEGEISFEASLEAFQRTAMRGMLVVHNTEQMELSRRSQRRLVSFAIALPSAEELTTYNLQVTLRTSKEAAYPVFVHLAETRSDLEHVRRNFRRSPFQVLQEYGLLDAGCIPVHMSVLDPEDIPIIVKTGTSPVITPWGSAVKGLEVESAGVFVKEQIRFAIASDCVPASAWESMRCLRGMSVGEGQRGPTALDLLSSATRIPARIAGQQRDLGTVEPGKKADLQFIDARRFFLGSALEFLSPSEIANALVERGSAADVCDVMVNGEFYVREREILPYSSEDLEQDLSNQLRAAYEPAPVGPETPSVTHSGEGESNDGAGLGEEGFRILRKGGQASHQPAAILPLDPRKDQSSVESKTIRKVFGEDDL